MNDLLRAIVCMYVCVGVKDWVNQQKKGNIKAAVYAAEL